MGLQAGQRAERPLGALYCPAQVDLMIPSQASWAFGCQGDFREKAGGLSGCPGFCARGHSALMLLSCCPSSQGPSWSHVEGPASFPGPAQGEGSAVASTELAPGLARARMPPSCPQGRCALGPAISTWHPASPWGLGSPASDMTWCEVRGSSAPSLAWLLVSLSTPRQCGSRPHGPDSGQGARDPWPRGCRGH